MTWIKTVPLTEADEKVRQAIEGQRALYPKEYGEPVHPAEGGGSSIVASHTLIPEALYHAFGTFGALMSPELPLSRRQHEMIATMVTLDKELVEALEKDYTTAPITAQERVMVDYVVKLTKDATRVWKDDIEGLRAAGFDDRGILQITLIASWFNYINRVADALGVGRE